ncbi:MAG TPA: MFS transporter [Bacillus bacterium]|uniref:MFS transporter n=1 Tax=Siminovitchia fordii TaxID=254759 RepID=A0ABQ4K6S1_9BACI|nr:MFS transporter [Siminovitchia fordii]GIN20631.1 MFS transporter [Siminovitchia fordii]HBZ08642.1 MFS transporter [Bacillus sp. (in: firmicutes)]
MRIFVYIIIFFSFFDLFSQLPIMTPLAGSLGATPFVTGLVVGMFSFSNMIGNIVSGFLTDKKGPFLILLAGLLLTSASLFLYQLAFDPLLLLFVRFIHGLHAGLIVPAAFTFMANTAVKSEKGKGVALSGAFIGLAAILGPAFSGILASRTTEVTVLQVTGIAILVLGILAFFILRKKNLASSPAFQKTKSPVHQLSLRGPILKAFVGAFFLMFSQGVLAYMLPLKVEALGNDAQTSGMLLSTFGVVAVLIFILPTNRLFDHLKPINTLAFGMLTMAISMICISFFESLSLLFVFMALYGIGFAFLFPSINSLLIESTTDKNRGKAYGYFYAFFSIGVVAGSGLTGLLELSANGGFLFTGILLCIATAFIKLIKNAIPVGA